MIWMGYDISNTGVKRWISSQYYIRRIFFQLLRKNNQVTANLKKTKNPTFQYWILLHERDFFLYQFSSVAQSCPTHCDPMNCSMPGLPVHHQFLEFTQTHIHWVGDAIQPSHPVVPFSSCPQSLPASESFPMSQLFTWGGQSTGVSIS